MVSIKHNIVRIISNIFFILAMVVAAYALFSLYMAYRSLPPGVCPVDNNRGWLYAAIILSVVSLVLSFFEGKNK
ncbi:hypothetical protein [Mahella sp.]|uniref:hypothetical protein n=1 Tax=Mahella sp. TaxID=2798721 RepID=UPI0025C69C94|nr:hypothetical protein [Mahella sp.]